MRDDFTLSLRHAALPHLQVPNFLRLFHSSDAAPGQSSLERRWVLRVVRDGMREGLDYAVAQKDHVVKMAMVAHDSTAFATTMAQGAPQVDQDDGKEENEEMRMIVQ